MLAVPRAPEAKKLLGESVEESRAKRVEKQQSRYRDRGGIFVPADSNPLLDILLARGVNGESPTKSLARSTRRNGTNTSSPVKGKRKVALTDDVAQGNGSRGEKKDNNAKARSRPKSTRQAASKAARGRKPNANVDIEANGEPVAGPSNVRGVKRNTKQGTRSARTKPKPLPTEADDDDDRPLGRSRKSKGKSADVAALNDPSDSGHHDAAEREGKQPSKSRNERKCGTERGDPDSDGDEPPAQKAKVKGKRKTPSGKADGKTGQETAEEPIPADVADAAEASDSKLTKGKQKAVDDASDVHIDKPERRPVTKAKRKIAPAKHDDQDADARPVPKPKGHKRTANRKRKAADTTAIDEVRQKTPLDTSEKLRSPESSPSLPVPRRHLTTLTSIHGASGSSELAAVEHESQTRPASVRRKRPYMYISSDSESEDDVPLRKAKPPSKAVKRDTETAREAKRAKTDKEAAADEGSESKPSEKKRRGGQTKTGRARRKKDGGGSGTEEGPADDR
ncbi:hypothetical protein NM688_g5347 [Phlebia brevispora]|uniref:Uncharacterized protein n=1 Tax=Phlebia brevispora TaxID=194682 RepID=A0ACC1SWM5_9APHY|nr:hypothetical protein NM688_g5347 [Phlebia brevispora]